MAMSSKLKEYRKTMRNNGFKMITAFYGEKTVGDKSFGISYIPSARLKYVVGMKVKNKISGFCKDVSSLSDAFKECV